MRFFAGTRSDPRTSKARRQHPLTNHPAPVLALRTVSYCAENEVHSQPTTFPFSARIRQISYKIPADTNAPLTYSPAVTSPAQLTFYQEATPGGPDVRCWLQTAGNVHTLPNLQGVPQLLLTGEASSAASTNRCVSKYLTQAGVPNTWLSLGMVGIHGNGHMMMLEKNQLEIAAFIASWLEDNVEHVEH